MPIPFSLARRFGRGNGVEALAWSLMFASPQALAGWAPTAWASAGLSALGGLVLGALLGAVWNGARQRQAQGALLNWVVDDEVLGDPPGLLTQDLPASMRTRLLERARRRRQAQRARELQLERLWRAASLDSASAVHSRRSFIARLDLHLRSGLLSGDELPLEPSGALLLLTVHGLERLNRVEGRIAGDGLIASVGATLRTYQDRVPGALAGRLTGADFALLLPVTGLAEETAHALQGMLQALGDSFSTRISVSVGAVEALRAPDASRALALADAALRQAQMGPLVCVLSEPGPAGAAPGDDPVSLWRRCVGGQGDLALDCAASVDAAGRRQGLLCALKMRGAADGGWVHARRWRQDLRVAGLIAAADLALLTLALRAVADGVVRTLEMDVDSLREPGFIEDVARCLAAQATPASRLVLELDTQALAFPWAVEAAAAAWHRAGAAVGLVYRGGQWPGLGQAAVAGAGRLAIDLRFLRRGAGDPSVLACAWQAVDTAHALGWAVDAREVVEIEDLPWIWEAGFQTASGPAVHSAAAVVQSPASGERMVPCAPQPISAQCRP